MAQVTQLSPTALPGRKRAAFQAKTEYAQRTAFIRNFRRNAAIYRMGWLLAYISQFWV